MSPNPPKSYSQRRRERKGPGRVPEDGREMPHLYAFLSASDGIEGIVAQQTPAGWTPLICSNRSQIATMRPFAAQVASGTGKPVRLVRFERDRLVETIEPGKDSGKSGHFVRLGPALYAGDAGPEMAEPTLLGNEPGPDDAILNVGLGVADGKVMLSIASGPITAEDLTLGMEPDAARALAEEILSRADLADGKTHQVIYLKGKGG